LHPPGSILTRDQQTLAEQLAATLDRDQAIWLSGYFAGLGGAATAGVAPPAPAVAAAPPGARTLTVLFGSETGNSRELAGALAEAARARGIPAGATDMGDYATRGLRDEQDLLLVCATHGEGDPPQAAIGFFEFLEGRRAPQLPGVRFAVLGLGDSTYEQFCGAARRLDERLAALGAERLAERVDCDVDYEDDAAEWMATVVDRVAASPRPGPSVAVLGAPAAAPGRGAAHDKRNPFAAPVLENLVLTGRGSTKETRHLELSLEGSGLRYEPGDALGVVPRNDPALVEALLDRLDLPAAAPVTVRGEPTTLGEALSGALEITPVTPRFLEHWAEITGAGELETLRATDQGTARAAFLRSHHVVDVVERFPAPGLEPERLVAALRPLQPRLYSIASSLAAAPDEAHLTVSHVRYALHDRERTGVASGHLARRTEEDATVPVYIQANEGFRLPPADVPIVMIGAGTGVAPYRAFMQEREAAGAPGRAWLFFGERNFRTDFLYQVEWQALLRRGVLDRLDLAFSRDAAPKTYVQDRLRERGRDVFGWLEEGAWLYVCGDAAQMAPDVHAALADVVAAHGGLDREGAEAYLADLRRDRRYRLDVY
jgi:sulfite reductase (NADPH) flavoprotein alpha-component